MIVTVVMAVPRVHAWGINNAGSNKVLVKFKYMLIFHEDIEPCEHVQDVRVRV
jgi:hypothetical protein